MAGIYGSLTGLSATYVLIFVLLALNTVGAVLAATEAELKEAHYVGDVRARRMRNAAIASVLEYLSG